MQIAIAWPLGALSIKVHANSSHFKFGTGPIKFGMIELNTQSVIVTGIDENLTPVFDLQFELKE